MAFTTSTGAVVYPLATYSIHTNCPDSVSPAHPENAFSGSPPNKCFSYSSTSLVWYMGVDPASCAEEENLSSEEASKIHGRKRIERRHKS